MMLTARGSWCRVPHIRAGVSCKSAGPAMSEIVPEGQKLSMVGEAALARALRRADLPVFVLFRSRSGAACRALAASLARLAGQVAGQAIVLGVDAERAPGLAEQHGVAAAPTVLVLHDREELTRLTGFAPEALLQLFFQDVLGGELTPGLPWSPVEQAYEDAVIIPLLDAWGWPYRRQVVCPPHPSRPVARGRIDILAYHQAAGAPLTLFEAKRQIASAVALQQASDQARSYAAALQLRSFVVAAPAGMWVYQLAGERARLAHSFSALEVASQPAAVRQALQRLATA